MNIIKLSKMKLARDLINGLILKNKYTTYLEIGIDRGVNFSSIVVEHKESVDPALDQYSHANPTFRCTSDEFFKSYPNKKYDLIFIDGLHHSEQVDRDIINSINALNDGGTVVLHDCLPVDEVSQLVPRQSSVWNGDVWKSIVKYKSTYHKLGCCVVDFDFGIGVINNKIPVKLIKPPVPLEYTEFRKNTSYYLDLIDVDTFKKLYL